MMTTIFSFLKKSLNGMVNNNQGQIMNLYSEDYEIYVEAFLL